MTITRVIFGKEMEFKLTEKERIQAYAEQQHVYDLADTDYHVQSEYDGIVPAVFEKLYADETLEDIATDARGYAEDSGIDFYRALEQTALEYAEDIAKDLGLSSIYEEENEA